MNYSEKAVDNSNDIKITGKKKYISIALITASAIGFAYYAKKEKEFGKLFD